MIKVRGASGVQAAPKATAIEVNISVRRVNVGTASESKSLVARLDGRMVRIERLGGNPFELDAKERALAGKTAKLRGFFVTPNLFRFEAATVSPARR